MDWEKIKEWFLITNLPPDGGLYMDDGRHEILTAEIVNQIPDLYLAELVQVADYIRGLKLARKFMEI